MPVPAKPSFAPPKKPKSVSDALSSRWLIGLVLAAVFAAYFPALKGGFIWDDDMHLTANACIIGPLGLKEVWTTANANYFPLVLTNFWVLHAAWGLNPLPYHLVTVLFHVGNALLLYLVLRQLGARAALLGAALWALHPVQAESVAWISELKNTQSCSFYLLSAFFFLRWLKSDAAPAPSQGAYTLALVCTTLALLSKPSTVMLPVALVLIAWWVRGRWPWQQAGRLLPIFLLSLATGLWAIWEQKFHSGALGAEWSQTWPERGVIAGKAVWFYLEKLLWPRPLIFIYPRWQIDASSVASYLPLLLGLAALIGLWFGRDGRMRPAFFAAAYFVVLLFPVLGFFSVFFFKYSFVSDHFQYLASIGPLALTAAGIDRLVVSSMRAARLLGRVAAVVLPVVFGTLTWFECGTYRDQATHFTTILERNPECWMAHNNLGLILFQSGRVAEAIPRYEASLALYPGNAEAHNNLGNAYLRMGRVPEAIQRYEEALRLAPKLAEAHNNLGNALCRLGRFPEAIEHYETTLRLKSDFADAYNNLGNALLQTGQNDVAIGRYEQALRIKPNYAEAHNGLGAALLNTGRIAEAAAHFEGAVRARPQFAEAHNNLGIALSKIGRGPDAIRHFEEALRLKPDYANARANLEQMQSPSTVRE